MKELIKKWWFWLIIVIIVAIIGFTAIMVVALNITTGGIHKVAKVVQNLDNDATVYTSAGGNTLIIEIPNYSDDTKKYKEEMIIEAIKQATGKNGVLQGYSKVIICERINSDEIKDYFITNKVYSLPDMTLNTEEGSIYIDFVEYTKKSLTTSSMNNDTTQDKGEDIELTAGKYTVGTDIKAGKYDAIAQANSGNFFAKGSTSVNEILSAKDDGYGIPKYSNLTLKTGDTVEISGRLILKLQAK